MKPIDMIYSQTLYHSLCSQPVQELMVFIKHMLFFHAKADQAIYYKKTPVIDLMVCSLPMRKRVMLLLKQQVQFFPIIIDTRNSMVNFVENVTILQAMLYAFFFHILPLLVGQSIH